MLKYNFVSRLFQNHRNITIVVKIHQMSMFDFWKYNSVNIY